MIIISPLRAGAALGAFLGLWHLIWSGLVAAGWAQAVVDFVLWLHFIKLPVAIQPFDIRLAAMLVVLTALVGFVVGWVFAVLWNRVHQTQG